MADLDVTDITEVVDKRFNRGTNGVSILAEINNLTSTSAMKTRLTALDPVAFTAARMNSMTKNDLIYAIRLRSSDAAGI